MENRTITTTHVSRISERIEVADTDRVGIFGHEISDSVVCLVHGLRQLDKNSKSLQLDTIGVVYRTFIEQVDYGHREELFRYMVQEVAAAQLDSALILAFVRFEPHHRLVCRAVWAYLQNRPVSFQDPFAATHDIISILINCDVVNRGAAYAGLILFGDRRVCAVARTIRDTISRKDARSFARTTTAPLYRVSIEFCLTWLADLVAKKRYEIIKEVCFALELVAFTDSTTPVHDRQYSFGPFAFRSTTTLPDVRFGDLLFQLMPMLESLAHEGSPDLNHMVEVFKDPTRSSYDQIRKRLFDRRNRDRRIVSIKAHPERRVGQGREAERRVVTRRTDRRVSDRPVNTTLHIERRAKRYLERRTHQRRGGER